MSTATRGTPPCACCELQTARPLPTFGTAPGLGLEAVAFAPIAGDTRMIARHERLGRWTPFIWDVATGAEQPLSLELPGDVSAQWFADASALLIAHDYQARTSLFRYDLATDSLSALATPVGTILGATARPDDVVEYSVVVRRGAASAARLDRHGGLSAARTASTFIRRSGRRRGWTAQPARSTR